MQKERADRCNRYLYNLNSWEDNKFRVLEGAGPNTGSILANTNAKVGLYREAPTHMPCRPSCLTASILRTEGAIDRASGPEVVRSAGIANAKQIQSRTLRNRFK
jgi:hypothetical protein